MTYVMDKAMAAYCVKNVLSERYWQRHRRSGIRESGQDRPVYERRRNV